MLPCFVSQKQRFRVNVVFYVIRDFFYSLIPLFRDNGALAAYVAGNPVSVVPESVGQVRD
jgi:hypothetical protein